MDKGSPVIRAYVLDGDEVVIEMLQGDILSVGARVNPLTNKESVYLWAMVYPELKTIHRTFFLVDENVLIPSPMALGRYLGVAHLKTSGRVVHVFGGMNSRG